MRKGKKKKWRESEEKRKRVSEWTGKKEEKNKREAEICYTCEAAS